MTALNISASPAAASTGSVEAHIIPTLKFGISLLNVDTDVFLALDTSATLTLTLEAQATSIQSVRRANHAKLLKARSKKSPPVAPEPTSIVSTKDYMPSASGFAATTSIAINPTCTCVLSPQSSIVTAIQGTETGSSSGTATSSATQTTSTSSSNDDSSSSFSGCFEVNAGLDVTAGADGDFFGLFDANTQVTLFSKNFELFKACHTTCTMTLLSNPAS